MASLLYVNTTDFHEKNFPKKKNEKSEIVFVNLLGSDLKEDRPFQALCCDCNIHWRKIKSHIEDVQMRKARPCRPLGRSQELSAFLGACFEKFCFSLPIFLFTSIYLYTFSTIIYYFN